MVIKFEKIILKKTSEKLRKEFETKYGNCDYDVDAFSLFYEMKKKLDEEIDFILKPNFVFLTHDEIMVINDHEYLNSHYKDAIKMITLIRIHKKEYDIPNEIFEENLKKAQIVISAYKKKYKLK